MLGSLSRTSLLTAGFPRVHPPSIFMTRPIQARKMTGRDPMVQTPAVTVDRAEMRDAFEFVSVGGSLGAEAYISRDTGKIYLRTVDGDVMEEEDEIPDDVETSDRYIAVPHKTELDLGRTLVLRFTEQELPGDYDTVRDQFRRKGAYARFKRLLEARGALQRWYDYEERATEEALRNWCQDNDILLIG